MKSSRLEFYNPGLDECYKQKELDESDLQSRHFLRNIALFLIKNQGIAEMCFSNQSSLKTHIVTKLHEIFL